ncbi:type III secretion system outer membrane ring subunit SctC [Piscinibacter sp.]|uniref:type III secretion system outer membrane ring subunit SctC n=1 Tax=Piscinibacter sp. TaxID=1903157 RepID=UPI002ED16ABB
MPPRLVRHLLCGLLAALLAAAGAVAAELPWRNRPFQVAANEKPIADFLRELAASQGTTAVVDSKVNGAISGKFSIRTSAQALLASICESNGLTWYYDGSFLFVEPASDARSEVLPVTPGSEARMTELLGRLKIADSRYPLAVSEGSIFVSGPKRYVEMVRQAVRSSDGRAARVDNTEIRLFPLKYAWAGDFKISRAGREVTIPGIASTLRSLYLRGHPTSTMTGGRSAGVLMRTGVDRQLRLRTGETVNAPKVEIGTPADGSDDTASLAETGSPDQPAFQADTRLNAVLVRDKPERMAQYARLIEALDTRPRLVEIELTIMDISTDTLDSLGIDWRLHGHKADLQIGTGDRPALTWGGATTEAGQVGGLDAKGNATTPPGGLFHVAIGSEFRNYLLARVNALAQRGNANFVARPKVLTLDNTEAVLENMSEIHVRVDGFQDAALFSITSGTGVRVTPLIVDEPGGRSVMLTINIEDGSVSGTATVDNIPVINRRTVNTQALMNEGTSLLLAGFTSEEKTNAVTGVPVLSELPVVGGLFRFTQKKQTNMERFYLLTPRLVLPSAGVPPPVQGG